MAKGAAAAAAVLIWSVCIVRSGDAFRTGLGGIRAPTPLLRGRHTSLSVQIVATSQQPEKCTTLGQSVASRRQVVSAGFAAALLLANPDDCSATDFRKAVEIFGSDGDQPPGFAEQLASKIGKTLDKNFIDKRRPPPVRLPRTEVYKPFAVLLMRSCYDAADALNFVSMEKFQKDFFLLRQVFLISCPSDIAETCTSQLL